jgi:hypothetical protein
MLSTARNPREITTEGLLIEHYLITLRKLEVACMRGRDAFAVRCQMTIRQIVIAD